jgi:hypothetical protein
MCEVRGWRRTERRRAWRLFVRDLAQRGQRPEGTRKRGQCVQRQASAALCLLSSPDKDSFWAILGHLGEPSFAPPLFD